MRSPGAAERRSVYPVRGITRGRRSRRCRLAAWPRCERSSADAHIVGQFVHVVGPPRKVPAEGLADLLDGVDQPVTRALLAQLPADGVDQPPPVGFAYALVDARVTDHGQLVIRYRNVDEHAIVLRRVMHAEPLEDLDGPRERVALAGMVEMHAYLRGGARLRLPHRARDRGEILLGEKGRDPLRMPSHHQSPLAPPPPKLPPPPP